MARTGSGSINVAIDCGPLVLISYYQSKLVYVVESLFIKIFEKKFSKVCLKFDKI